MTLVVQAIHQLWWEMGTKPRSDLEQVVANALNNEPQDIGLLPHLDSDTFDAAATDVSAIMEASVDAADGTESPDANAPISLSDGMLDDLQHLKEQLEVERSRRAKLIHGLRDEIISLWARMEMETRPFEEIVGEHHAEFSPDAISALQAECDRMLQLKRQNIGKFIASVREDIANMWKR